MFNFLWSDLVQTSKVIFLRNGYLIFRRLWRSVQDRKVKSKFLQGRKEKFTIFNQAVNIGLINIGHLSKVIVQEFFKGVRILDWSEEGERKS